ncbi:MAG: DNA gyrase subunit A [Chloroflexi bacterium]|nr:DNA gyrase subunit A [Chloroflexota bacterium]
MVEQTVTIREQMETAYLSYAMSVIVSRALPDVRDGLKPVQRRVLYAMHDLGMRNSGPHRKSARVVGDVIAKYHPHGDSPVYEALVRLAQPFSLRYPLVDGQGNFGSVDNDPPAAMRYTEARLSAIADELLADIDRETVTFAPNFDGSEREPTVLPAKIPNLLINGATGIAVGMATNIPPHNLTEVCDAILFALSRWQQTGSSGTFEATLDELLQFVKGPDFPTAATIRGTEGLTRAYATGQGKVVMEARAVIEEGSRGQRPQILITELPYQVNKAALVEKIADLVRSRRVDGVAEVRDESDRDGLRVVIELRRDAQPEVVLNNLYEHTSMRQAFHINMLALVDGRPQVLSLRQLILLYIQFRREVVINRTRYELRRAEDRAHVLEGLRIALDNLDAVIALIRASENVEAARIGLTERYNLSIRQAQAILDMQLRRLAALERQAILDELAQLHARIADLEDLLARPDRITTTVREEVEAVKTEYGDVRRTEIIHGELGEVRREDLIPHAEVVVTLSNRGYVKRVAASTYRIQRRGGRGVTGMTTRDEDAVQHLLVCDTHDTLLFFTNRGRVWPKRCFELPAETTRTARGIHLQNVTGALEEGERVTTVIAAEDLSGGDHLLLTTRKGEVKRTPLRNFTAVRSSGIIAMDLDPGDELVSAIIANESDHIILVTAHGKAIRFEAAKLTPHSRTAGGVRGIRLLDGDYVVGATIVKPDHQLFLITRNGYGKRTSASSYPTKGRGGQGVITLKAGSARTGPVVAIAMVDPEQELMLVSQSGIVIRTTLKDIRSVGRSTQGVIVMRMDANDEVAALASFAPTVNLEAT